MIPPESAFIAVLQLVLAARLARRRRRPFLPLLLEAQIALDDLIADSQPLAVAS